MLFIDDIYLKSQLRISIPEQSVNWKSYVPSRHYKVIEEVILSYCLVRNNRSSKGTMYKIHVFVQSIFTGIALNSTNMYISENLCMKNGLCAKY